MPRSAAFWRRASERRAADAAAPLVAILGALAFLVGAARSAVGRARVRARARTCPGRRGVAGSVCVRGASCGNRRSSRRRAEGRGRASRGRLRLVLEPVGPRRRRRLASRGAPRTQCPLHVPRATAPALASGGRPSMAIVAARARSIGSGTRRGQPRPHRPVAAWCSPEVRTTSSFETKWLGHHGAAINRARATVSRAHSCDLPLRHGGDGARARPRRDDLATTIRAFRAAGSRTSSRSRACISCCRRDVRRGAARARRAHPASRRASRPWPGGASACRCVDLRGSRGRERLGDPRPRG